MEWGLCEKGRTLGLLRNFFKNFFILFIPYTDRTYPREDILRGGKKGAKVDAEGKGWKTE